MSEITSQKVDSVDNVTVSGGVLADLFSLTDRRIRQLADEGIIVRVKKGRYDLVSSVKNYIIHIKTNNDLKDNKSDVEIDLERERALHEKVKRAKSEIELAAMRGEMHHSSDVERVMNDMLGNFRAKILAMPSKLAPLLVARNELAIIQQLIKKECNETLEELAAYDASLFYNDKYIDLDESGTEEGENVEGETTKED